MTVKVKKDTLVYKGAYARDEHGRLQPVLVTMLLRKGTLVRKTPRLSDRSKNRSNRAHVLRIERQNGHTHGVASAKRDTSFTYRVDEVVKPKYRFDKSPNECASGIHFYMHPHEAWLWVGVSV